MDTQATFILYAFVPLLLNVAIITAMILIILRVGGRARQLRTLLWLPLIIYVGGGLAFFAINMVISMTMFNDPMSTPGDSQIQSFVIGQEIAAGVQQILFAGIFVSYCLAAVRATRLQSSASSNPGLSL